MSTSTQTVPKTAIEIYDTLPEGTRCVVIKNILYMSPAPTERHEWLRGELFTQINTHVKKHKLGKAYSPTPDVYFMDQLSAFIPDIAVILTDNLGIIQKGKIYGAPDVVVEVLSTDRKRDRQMKADVYEKAGVKEYFIVDPENCETTCFSLINEKYQAIYKDQPGIFRSVVLELEFSFEYE